MMISAVSWIPKGASKPLPVAAEPPSEEEIKDLLQNGVAHAKAVAKSFGKPCSKSNGASSSSSTDPDDVANFLKELDMDNYDEEDDEIELFSSGQGDLYYPSNKIDPYLKDTESNYDSDDLDDMTIQPTDSLIVCTGIKDEVNYLEVYVCEDSGNGTHNMYLRNDMIIPKPPLCIAFLRSSILSPTQKHNFMVLLGTCVRGTRESSETKINRFLQLPNL